MGINNDLAYGCCEKRFIFIILKSSFAWEMYKIGVIYSNAIKQCRLNISFSIEEIHFRRILTLYVLEVGFTTVNQFTHLLTYKFKVMLLFDQHE